MKRGDCTEKLGRYRELDDGRRRGAGAYLDPASYDSKACVAMLNFRVEPVPASIVIGAKRRTAESLGFRRRLCLPRSRRLAGSPGDSPRRGKV